MSVGSLHTLKRDGRARGYYVVVLCYPIPDHVVVKLGVTSSPLEYRPGRYELQPSKYPTSLCYVEVGPRGQARRVEDAFLASWRAYHLRKQWFRVELSQLCAFNISRREVLSRFSSINRELKWEIIRHENIRNHVKTAKKERDSRFNPREFCFSPRVKIMQTV